MVRFITSPIIDSNSTAGHYLVIAYTNATCAKNSKLFPPYIKGY
jgi:hypothetical protein